MSGNKFAWQNGKEQLERKTSGRHYRVYDDTSGLSPGCVGASSAESAALKEAQDVA